MEAADREDNGVDGSNPGRQGDGKVGTNEEIHSRFCCKCRRGMLRWSGPRYDETCKRRSCRVFLLWSRKMNRRGSERERDIIVKPRPLLRSVIYTILAEHAGRRCKRSEASGKNRSALIGQLRSCTHRCNSGEKIGQCSQVC